MTRVNSVCLDSCQRFRAEDLNLQLLGKVEAELKLHLSSQSLVLVATRRYQYSQECDSFNSF